MPQSDRKTNRHRNLQFEACERRDLFAADLNVRLWLDADGVREINEASLAGGVVELFANDGNGFASVGTSVSNALGIATFSNLDASLSYMAQVRPPVGLNGTAPHFSLTLRDAALIDETVDSDFDLAGEVQFILTDNVLNDNLGAGFIGNLLNWGWASESTNLDVNSNNAATDIAIDSADNAVVVGKFTGNIDLDSGPGTYEVTSTPGVEATYIAKYTNGGALLWGKVVAGSGNVTGENLSVDHDGNIIVVGNFSGTADFDPSSNVSSASGSNALFVLKLDSDGHFEWVKVATGQSSRVRSVDTDALGNISVYGSFGGTAVLDNALSQGTLVSRGSTDMFVWQISASGETNWAHGIGGTGMEGAGKLSVAPDGSVILAGTFRNDVVDFDPGSGTFNLIGGIDDDVVVLKLNSDGEFVWAKQLAGAATDSVNAVAVDQDGNVVLGGITFSLVQFDPGNAASQLTGNYLWKLNSAGDFVWVVNGSTVRDIAIDPSGDVLTVGTSFIAKFRGSNGDSVWYRFPEQGSTVTAWNLAVDSQGRPLAVGRMQQTGTSTTVDFDPSVGTFFLPLPQNEQSYIWSTNTFFPPEVVPYDWGVFEGEAAQVQLLVNDNGSIVEYAWDLDQDGEYDDYTGASSTIPWVALEQAGIDGSNPNQQNFTTYQTAVRVQNNDGQYGFATGTLRAYNVSPVIPPLNLPNLIQEGTTTTFSTAAFDPAGVLDPLSIRWTITAPGFEQVLFGSSIEFTPAEKSAYHVELFVTDGDGGTATASANVAVNLLPDLLNLQIPTSGIEGTLISISGDVSDPDGNDPTVQMVITGPNGFAQTFDTLDVSFIPPDNGAYTVAITAADLAGGVVTFDTTIEVANAAPTIQALIFTPAVEGRRMRFTATATDPAGSRDPLTYRWLIRGEKGYRFQVTGGRILLYTPPDNGRYSVTLQVRDGDGGVDSQFEKFLVRNVPPTIVKFLVPTTTNLGQPTRLRAVARPGPGTNDRLTYNWIITGPTGIKRVLRGPDVTFTPVGRKGNYEVRLEVTDGDGGLDPDVKMMRVL